MNPSGLDVHLYVSLIIMSTLFIIVSTNSWRASALADGTQIKKKKHNVTCVRARVIHEQSKKLKLGAERKGKKCKHNTRSFNCVDKNSE